MPKVIIAIFVFFGVNVTAQHQDKVDFISAQVTVHPIPVEKSIVGVVTYQFIITEKVDSIFLDAKNMDFTSVKLDNRNREFDYDGNHIIIRDKFKKGRTHSLRLEYACTPKQTVYFIGWDDTIGGNPQTVTPSRQVWTQGQGKYTSHWLPSFDAMEEKVAFDVSIQAASDFKVISNGKLMHQVHVGNETIWKFDMEKPMSSYLLAFAMGNYRKQELTSGSGVPIENYFYPGDSLLVEPTYRHTKEIFDFLEAEIGVPYPWQHYKQVPVHDFLYAGMENTTVTIFSDAYMIDSTAFVDRNYVNINAHELAHQWFGNLVTEKDGNHHWLHEGFATYYAYLAEKELFGDDHFYWKLYESAQQLHDLSEEGKGESLLDPTASSLTFYEKGAWALVALRELVGDASFKKGVQQYLYKHQFKNVTVADFLTAMTKASQTDLSAYKKMWLDSATFPIKEAVPILKKYAASLDILMRMDGEYERMGSDDLDYGSYWEGSSSVHLKKQLLMEHHRVLPKSLIEKAFATDTVPIRQALATSLLGMSASAQDNGLWKTNFESLLDDKSYVTQEIALIKLWSVFELDRTLYLDKLAHTVGLPNKNVRLLWLTLALLTPEYRTNEKAGYLRELIGYTTAAYNPELRQIAFTYLSDIGGMNAKAYRELIKSTHHHSWQFRNFARALLDGQLQTEEGRIKIQAAAKELKDDDLRYLKTKLKLE